MLEQQIGDQILMPVPPLRFLGFGAEFRYIDQNGFSLALFRLHNLCLTFLFAVCAVMTRILTRRLV